MELRFFMDPETGVTEEEVRQVLGRPGDDFQGRKQTRIALGQTAAGRYLQVVYIRDKDDDNLFVLTAYPLVGKALSAYRRRRRKRK